MPEKYNFKCIGQECETQACHTREQIRITIGDITRWSTSGHLADIISRMWISLDKQDPQSLAMVMFPKPLKNDSHKMACTFFNEENKSCEIENFKPISCRTYPLEYNGEKFYVSDRNCQGIGKGEITKDALQEARSLAEQEYNERMMTRMVIPGLYNIVMTTIMIQNEAAMKDLSPEDKAKLEEIMAKTDSSSVEPDKPKTGDADISKAEADDKNAPDSES